MFGKPSKDQFASQLSKAIQKLEPKSRFEYDANEFRLTRKDKEGLINLTNLYAEHCSLPLAKRTGHLQRLAKTFAGSVDDLPTSFEEAKSHLRPKIWNRSYFALIELKQRIEGGKEHGIPLYPVGSHLYSSLVYDTEHSMRSLSTGDLETWGVSYYEALEIACRNLDETTMALATIGDHFHSSVSGDNYDSSRVLLLDRVRSFDVVGEHIAVVPQRDAMYVAGSKDEQSLKIMFDLAAKTIAEEPRPLCPLPLRLEEGEWVDWAPPKNHVLRHQFEHLELRFLGGLYTDQKELLDNLFEGDDDAPFVATFSAMQKDGTETLRSYCAWSRGVDSLLPRTQLVMFVTDDGLAAAGEWDHVAAVVGDLMDEDDTYYPTRYRVRAFPNAEQLAEVGTLDL